MNNKQVRQAMPENTNIPKPKRLLVVSQHFWPETFRINDIVEGFLQDGIEVDVLCGLPNYPKGEWFSGYSFFSRRKENYNGANVFRAGEIRRKGNTSLRIFLNYISFPFFAFFNLPRFAGKKYDAIFCYETSPVLMAFPAIVLSKLKKIPLTTYVLDLWPDNLYSVLPVKNIFLRTILQKTSDWHYRHSTRLIAMSDQLAEKLLLNNTKKTKEDIAVIPQYCEDFYADDIHDVELADRYSGWFNILFTGNISPAQDLENLANAIKIVKDSGQGKIRCIIVGDGMAKDALTAYIKSLGLEKEFVFSGACPPTDIPRWTTTADALFAGLAKSDNLGLTVPAKITSYFAAGRPMLVAADGEAAKVSKSSGAALISPAGDAKRLAENIIKLYTMSGAQRKKMGGCGRQEYYQNYNREKGLAALKAFIFQPPVPERGKQ